MGRREHRKRLTRRELLAAGRKLFAEKGLYESRVEDLTRHAGIAKGTLYGYFANKKDLIEAVVNSGFGELLGHVQRQAQGAGSHIEVVSRVVRAHMTFFEENPDLMRILHQARGLLKFHRPEGRPLRRVLADYLAGLAHALAPHHPVRGNRALLESATLVFGAVSGVTSTRVALGDARPRSLATPATVRAMVAMVEAFEGAPSRGRGTSRAARSLGREP